ncbi:MAG: glycosyl transferase [Candidatus Gottesmanbacteria bacterium GW2011_GWA2_43_14]|uniref:Glycosyl transferase n=1 Tax=Candidatus Gottesmanbacteria bacterium GW2011_GWA2_43_14 TaxID=1618443 RepID=A0A0G1DJA9_9BACT|nr:MAG: glycosyl transferase [Candidatus Gottesmanbacteria bacterium GW2011_GWA2_43_14]
MKKPRLSVVIPTLQEEKYLKIALDSLKKQTFKDFEIIIADGGSKDKTVAIAKKYTDKVFVFDGANVCLSRDKGTRLAEGDIIAGADADTFYPENYLETVLQVFDKNKDASAMSGKIYFYNCPWWWKPVWWIFYSLFEAIYIFTGKVVYAPALNLAFRKSAFLKVNGYNTKLDFGGDEIDFLMRLKQAGKIHYITKPVPQTHSRRLKIGISRYFFVQLLYNYWLNYLTAKILGKAIIKAKPVR